MHACTYKKYNIYTHIYTYLYISFYTKACRKSCPNICRNPYLPSIKAPPFRHAHACARVWITLCAF